MIELTQEQRRELFTPQPVAIDPETRDEYVLVKKAVYEKLMGLLDDDSRLMYPLLADIDSEDWEDHSAYADKP